MAGKILIYGGTGGVGADTARLLRARGHQLHLVARGADRLVPLAAELDAGWTAGDVRDSTLFPRVAEEAGAPLAGLVYAVGTITLGPLGRLEPDTFLNDYVVNVVGAAQAVRAALPALRQAEDGSAVVLFSSVAAGRGFRNHASIGAAKAGVEGLTRALAAELAPAIRVNAVAPSLTRTPLAAGLLGNERVEEGLAKAHPLRRLGRPDDLARTAAFLVSTEAAWLTGQVLGVDGGRGRIEAA